MSGFTQGLQCFLNSHEQNLVKGRKQLTDFVFLLTLQILSSLAQIGAPDPDADSSECSIIHGLAAAVEQLSEPTDVQQQMKNALMEDSEDTIKNTGRIVCITGIKR